MLPDLAGTLAMLAGHAMKILDTDVKNPDGAMWEKIVCLIDLLL
jgi:hypothetical protein